MPTLPLPASEEDQLTRATGHDYLEEPLGYVLGQSLLEPFRQVTGAAVTAIGSYFPEHPDAPLVDPTILNEQANKRNLGLRFDQPETQEVADYLMSDKEAELIRKDVFNRAPPGFISGASQFAATLVGSFLDPLSLAAGVSVELAVARAAGSIFRAGLSTGQRALRGAAEGATGNLLVEPVAIAAADRLQRDYTLLDSMANVTFGALAGATLGAGGGLLVDFLRRRSVAAQETAHRTALAQMISDIDVDVSPVLGIDVAERRFRSGLRSSTSLSRAGVLDQMNQAIDNPALHDPYPQGFAAVYTKKTQQPAVFPNKNLADAYARRYGLEGSRTVDLGNGLWGVEAPVIGDLARRQDGTIRAFSSPGGAKAARRGLGYTAEEATPVRLPGAEERWGLFVGLPEDAARINKAPNFSSFPERTGQKPTLGELTDFLNKSAQAETEISRQLPIKPAEVSSFLSQADPLGISRKPSDVRGQQSVELAARETIGGLRRSIQATEKIKTGLDEGTLPDRSTLEGEVAHLEQYTEDLRSQGLLHERASRQIAASSDLRELALEKGRLARQAAACLGAS